MIRSLLQRSFSRSAIQRQVVSNPGKGTIAQIFLYSHLGLKAAGTTKNLPTTTDDPLQHDDYFNVRSMVNLDDLFK